MRLFFSCIYSIFSVVGLAILPVVALNENEVRTIARSVVIQIDAPNGNGGSGILIDKNEGNNYTILTACHVLHSVSGNTWRPRPGNYIIHLPHGTTQTIRVDNSASHCAVPNDVENGLDLATLEFSSPTEYQIAELKHFDDLDDLPSLKTYTYGFPNPTGLGGKRSHDWNQGRVTRLEKNAKQGYEIVYDLDQDSGMSGGALFDEEGLVVGIIVAKKRAIPTYLYYSHYNPRPNPNYPVLRSQLGQDLERMYDRLEAYTSTGEWQKADEQNLELLLQIGDRDGNELSPDEAKQFSCPDLQRMNEFWSNASNGRFGYSAQLRVIEGLGLTPQTIYDARQKNDYRPWRRFVIDTGWARGDERDITYQEWPDGISFRLDAPEGHLPSGRSFPDLNNNKNSTRISALLAHCASSLQDTSDNPVTSPYSVDQIKNLAKASTVRIFSRTNNIDTAGSGVIVLRQNDTHLIITSRSTVNQNDRQYSIQTADNKMYAAQVVPIQATEDVCFLKFTSTDQDYPILPSQESPSVTLEQRVFAGGFPFLDTTQEFAPFEFTDGSVQLVLPEPFRGGYTIGYTNQIIFGMGGGPVVNAQGKLIGINGLLPNPLITNAYEYQNGILPSSQIIEMAQNLSWAVPLPIAAIRRFETTNIQRQTNSNLCLGVDRGL